MTAINTPSSSKSRTTFFESSLQHLSKEALISFQQISRFYALFHLTFFAVGILEILFFLMFFSFLAKSFLLAFTIAAFFLTVFSYFILHFYHQTKKPHQYKQIVSTFIDGCRGALPFEEGSSDLHLSAVNGIYHLIQALGKAEYQFYAPKWFQESLTPMIKKLSAWLHWKDVLELKENLYSEAVEELLILIRSRPTDLEAHGALASCYFSFSRIYCDPRKVYPEEDISWVAQAYAAPEMRKKFETVLWLSLEEWQIVNEYAGGDPWIYSQIADIYRELNLQDKEMELCEIIMQLSPQNREIQYRLGVLYFQNGRNAKGLKIYEHLKKLEDPKAQDLIQHFGVR